MVAPHQEPSLFSTTCPPWKRPHAHTGRLDETERGPSAHQEQPHQKAQIYLHTVGNHIIPCSTRLASPMRHHACKGPMSIHEARKIPKCQLLQPSRQSRLGRPSSFFSLGTSTSLYGLYGQHWVNQQSKRNQFQVHLQAIRTRSLTGGGHPTYALRKSKSCKDGCPVLTSHECGSKNLFSSAFAYSTTLLAPAPSQNCFNFKPRNWFHL